jgi:hypothetical protein
MTDPFEQASRVEHDRSRRRRQRALRSSLRIHAAVFVFIQVLLVVIWAMTGAGFAWFVFPLLGWGAGLAAHAVVVRESAGLAADDERSGQAP